MSIHPNTSLAEIPFLDMSGPEFILFYLIALVMAVIWTKIRKRKAYAAFSVPGSGLATLDDPYEAAFLAAGVPRMAQLALVRMVQQGTLTYKKSLLARPKLIAAGQTPPDASDLELAILREVFARGDRGLPIHEVSRIVNGRSAAIEARLATKGLRPTRSERSGIGLSSVLPLIALMVLGILKVAIGIARDKPVVFLIMALAVTLVITIVMGTSGKILTPDGERVLKGMRSGVTPLPGTTGAPDLSHSSMAIALLGVAGASTYVHAMGIDSTLEKELTHIAPAGGGGSDGGGSGCSSGCGSSGSDGGSSGCGGGCGGCGGGGD